MSKDKFKIYEGVFDEFTLNNLELLKRKKYFDELMLPIKCGKEADVYLARQGKELRAIKIYRVTNANFKKIKEYISNDYRFKGIKTNFRKTIFMWVGKEWRNLNLMYKNNICVPTPYKYYKNIIIMEYIDSQMLKDIPLEEPQKIFDRIVLQLKLLVNEAKLIHGDLSGFNILMKDDFPCFIDVGQSVNIKNEGEKNKFEHLFLRDIKNIVNFFNKKYDLEIDYKKIFEKIYLK